MCQYVKNGKLVKMSDDELTDLASSKYLCIDVMRVLAHHKNVHFRSTLGLNKKTPLEILEILAKDKAKTVQCSIIDNPNCSNELHEYLYSLNRGIIESRLISSNYTSTAIKKKILSSKLKNDVVKVLCWNRNLKIKNIGKKAIYKILGHSNVNIRPNLLSNTNLPKAIFMNFALSGNLDFMYHLSENKHIGSEVIEILIGSKDPDILRSLLVNNNTSENQLIEICTFLFENKLNFRSSSLINHPNAQSSLLELLYSKEDCKYYFTRFVNNPHTPTSILSKIEMDHTFRLREPETYVLLKSHPNYKPTASHLLDVLASYK